MSTINTAIFGLVNDRNTCFFNSILQCLLNVSDMNKYILGEQYKQKMDKDEQCILYSYFNIVKTINKHADKLVIDRDTGETTAVNPGSFKHLFFKKKQDQFIYGRQQDAHELLVAILDTLHDAIKEKITKCDIESLGQLIRNIHVKEFINLYIKDNFSFIVRIFNMQICTVRKCNICEYTLNSHEYYNNLPLMIPTSKCTLEDCLINFFKKNVIIDDYKCDKCNRTNCVGETPMISLLPKILIITLKRFIGLNKNCAYVDFPFDDLDLYQYMGQEEVELAHAIHGRNDHKYKLIGTVNHYGSLTGGHYNAFCRKEGEWFFFDDATVIHVTDEKKINKEHAYLLFYERT